MFTLFNWTTIAIVFATIFLIGLSLAFVSSNRTSELVNGIAMALVAAICFTVGLALCISRYNLYTNAQDIITIIAK